MSRTPVNLFLDEQAAGGRRTEPADSAAPIGGLVDAVRPDSIAAAVGIRPGARVLAANGHTLRDVVDYQFYTAEPVVALRVREPEGGEREYTVEKWPDDDLGLEFAEATWDGVRICANTCFFCFLKGLPKGLRRTLYVKDDDYRLSFLHGNFVTLTNLTDADWARLEEQRLSPLNVSVHATELDLRRRMLGYPDAPDIVAQLRRLGSLRIQAHTQIVLCPGINDGAHLDRTIADLSALYPTVQSISVVPVGATMQFEQRMTLAHKPIDETRACSPAYARRLVRQIRRWQRRLRDLHGVSIVQAADEYLLTAGVRIPAARWYDGFEQYENGIGMTRTLLDDWRKTRRRLRNAECELRRREASIASPRSSSDGRPSGDGTLLSSPRNPQSTLRIVVGCGTLIAPVLAQLFGELDVLTGTRSRVVPVRNEHFGPRINVSGLLSAHDVISTLKEEGPADLVILPRTALDYFGRKFLDDGTPRDVEQALQRPVAFASTMSEVIERVASVASGGVPIQPKRNETTNGIFWSAR